MQSNLNLACKTSGRILDLCGLASGLNSKGEPSTPSPWELLQSRPLQRLPLMEAAAIPLSAGLSLVCNSTCIFVRVQASPQIRAHGLLGMNLAVLQLAIGVAPKLSSSF